MRTETDEFKSSVNEDLIEAFIDGDDVFVSTTIDTDDGFESLNVLLDKPSVREFARQLLEMCGQEG